MSVKAAIDAFCDLSVTGVTVFDLDGVPGHVVEPLPALIPVLGFSPYEFRQFTTSELGRVTVQVDHLLLVAGSAGVQETRQYDTLVHVDNYLDALKADWRLSDTLVEPLRLFVIDWGPVNYRGLAYSGVVFRHEWKVLI